MPTVARTITKNVAMTRNFSKLTDAHNDEGIPEDSTRQTGRRKEEIDYGNETDGGSLYNRDSIMPPLGSGTKENPIMVPSGLEERCVGFEDPETMEVTFFNLQRGGKLHYIERLGLYFKMHELEMNEPAHH
jgi:hypothetical protein